MSYYIAASVFLIERHGEEIRLITLEKKAHVSGKRREAYRS